jgi:hypothetical protein
VRLSFPKLVAALLVLAGIGWGISKTISSRKEHREEEEQRQETTRLEHSISGMVAAHNGVIDWKKELGNKLNLDPIYTVHLQGVLIRADGRPLLFYASVDDVKQQQDGNYLLVLSSSVDVRATIRLTLECEPDRAREVLGQRGPELNRYYAVIAQIRSVQKIAHEVPSGVDTETGDSTSEIPVFATNGRVLDLMYVGAYGLARDLD